MTWPLVELHLARYQYLIDKKKSRFWRDFFVTQLIQITTIIHVCFLQLVSKNILNTFTLLMFDNFIIVHLEKMDK